MDMESGVLICLKHERSSETTISFLRRFIRHAHGPLVDYETDSLANFLADLSLRDYNMLRYSPSCIAASAIFLAKFKRLPTKRPWDSSLARHMQYNSSNMGDCILALHELCCSSHLPTAGIRQKYSDAKHKFVALTYGPEIPEVEPVVHEAFSEEDQLELDKFLDAKREAEMIELSKILLVDDMRVIHKNVINLKRLHKNVINLKRRTKLIDWLAEVAEDFNFVPQTLYLTVHYIDSYLSKKVTDKDKLKLLGVACLMIASNYEDTFRREPRVFLDMTDNAYSKEELMRMESCVLICLKHDRSAKTTISDLRRFIRPAHGLLVDYKLLGVLAETESLANFLVELSLLDCNMLRYSTSCIAASAIFLAKYIHVPAERPWDSSLTCHTRHNPSDLGDCVLALHQLCLSLPANGIRQKYSKDKYMNVAKTYCPTEIPEDFFQNEPVTLPVLSPAEVFKFSSS